MTEQNGAGLRRGIRRPFTGPRVERQSASLPSSVPSPFISAALIAMSPMSLPLELPWFYFTSLKIAYS